MPDMTSLILLTEVHQSLKLILFSVSPSVMAVVRFYSNEAVQGRALQRAAKLYPHLSITAELCYNVELTGECTPEKMWNVLVSETGVKNEKHSTCAPVSFFQFVHVLIVSSCFLLQAVRVSVKSRRRFSSGCFVLPCRQSRCLRNQTSQRATERNWWRSDPGTAAPTHTME